MRKHIFLLTLLIGGLVAASAALFLNISFLPVRASEEGKAIDHTLGLLLAIAGGMFALILVLLVYGAVLFRRRPGEEGDGRPVQSNMVLVGAFFLIPAALILWSATFGAVKLQEVSGPLTGYHEGLKQVGGPLVPAERELEVKVVAFQWGWQFEYPQFGITSGELVLPAGRPVHYSLTSRDVVHSFWVPEWRVKMDTLPGMVTRLRVTPNREGQYKAVCAELCGLGHTVMAAPVKVVSEEAFQSWVRERKR